MSIKKAQVLKQTDWKLCYDCNKFSLTLKSNVKYTSRKDAFKNVFFSHSEIFLIPFFPDFNGAMIYLILFTVKKVEKNFAF